MWLGDTLLASSLLFLLRGAAPVESTSVMSVDLGAEWMKVAVVTVNTTSECQENSQTPMLSPMYARKMDGSRRGGSDPEVTY